MKKGILTKQGGKQYQDFRTGLLAKGFMFLGALILISYLVIQGLLSLLIHGESYLEWDNISSWLSLSLVFIVIGIILYFIHLQLMKLGKIMEELETEQNNTPIMER
jgi:hypothetical protein